MTAAFYNLEAVVSVLATILLSLLVIGFGLLLERIRPVRGSPDRAAIFNVVYMMAAVFIQGAIAPLVLAGTATVVSALGGGLVALPAEELGLVPAALVYVVTVDFLEYLFHRAQHAVPALWAMHSLHHSDPAMNVSTTSRHFWLEQAIKSVTIYLAVSLIFAASPLILLIYGVVSYYNFFPHMNLRVGFGRFVLLNSPQNHRIHHSSQPVHRDKNFAGLFPVFDLMGGTQYMPAADEYPATGLDDGDQPVSLTEAIAWPARGVLRRGLRQPAAPAR
ncbi:MAG TPA: sterol desaturase family protein [Xanthobacteraceae bacterium]|jgi:sterol desaturase/sphingolipid hydroxylase (fatty acid hydroxylase superfamily)|nr:sterol desaturase family protein [Xanthobacteraceae bacterium]